MNITLKDGSVKSYDQSMRVIDIAYLALIPVVPVRGGDDAKEAAWFNVSFGADSLRIRNEELGVDMAYSLEKKVFRNGVVKYTNYVPSCVSEEKLAFDHVEILLEGLLIILLRQQIVFPHGAQDIFLPLAVGLRMQMRREGGRRFDDGGQGRALGGGER